MYFFGCEVEQLPPLMGPEAGGDNQHHYRNTCTKGEMPERYAHLSAVVQAGTKNQKDQGDDEYHTNPPDHTRSRAELRYWRRWWPFNATADNAVVVGECTHDCLEKDAVCIVGVIQDTIAERAGRCEHQNFSFPWILVPETQHHILFAYFE